MSDTATATAEAPAEPTSEQLDEQVLAQLDEFGQQALRNVITWTTEYNTVVGQLNALGGDPQALLESLRENPPQDAPEAVALAARISEAKAKLFEAEQKLDSMLKGHVERIRNDAQPQRAELEATASKLNDAIKTGRNFLKKLPDGPAGIERLFPKLATAKGTKSSAGTGIRRIRGRKWTVGAGDDAKTYDGAGEAAKALGVDTSAFQEAFFRAAGSDDASKWAPTVQFAVRETPVVSQAAA